MSTKAPELPSTQTADNDARRKRARRVIGSVVTAAIAVGGGVSVAKELGGGEDRQSTHSRITPGKTPPPTTASPSEKPTENVMKTIEQLPGYGKQVTEQQRQMLRASTVEVITSQKDLDDPYTTIGICTGLKVSVGGQNYIATARHCFVDGVEAADVYPYDGKVDRAHDPTLNQPRDITESVKNLRKEVSIYTLDAHGDADIENGNAVESITASFYPDMALLKVADGDTTTKFNALPAIAYESLLGGAAEPGAQTVIYSTPISAGPRMIETRGTYLGTTSDPGDEASTLAWVAINAADVAKDGCYRGGSGSAAYIADAGLTGPLHGRNHPGDEFAVGGEDDRRSAILEQLGVDLGNNDTTLCGFSVITPDIANNMAQVAAAN